MGGRWHQVHDPEESRGANADRARAEKIPAQGGRIKSEAALY
jgi:hypothetical protein